MGDYRIPLRYDSLPLLCSIAYFESPAFSGPIPHFDLRSTIIPLPTLFASHLKDFSYI